MTYGRLWLLWLGQEKTELWLANFDREYRQGFIIKEKVFLNWTFLANLTIHIFPQQSIFINKLIILIITKCNIIHPTHTHIQSINVNKFCNNAKLFWLLSLLINLMHLCWIKILLTPKVVYIFHKIFIHFQHHAVWKTICSIMLY